jgi:nitrogen regulatory protein PII 1
MKMIMTFVRPEKVANVASMLNEAGLVAYTWADVYGRGKQKGVHVRDLNYDMPKTMIITVMEDDRLSDAVKVIENGAQTGNFGDGKIFVLPVEEAYTVRTGKAGL